MTELSIPTAAGVFDAVAAGPPGGRPVLLLHGFPQTRRVWRRQIAALAADGYRVVAPDQRGYSPGARPRSRFAYRVADLVADISALIDEIGGKAHVAGHDWGAVPAWGIAARHPDRVASLTAVSVGHPRAFLRALVTSDQFRKSYYMAVFQIPILPERTLSKPGSRGEQALRDTGMPEVALKTYRREVVGDGALRGGLNWYRSMPLMRPKDLGRVTVPTTLVWSDDDVALGRRMAELTAEYVNAPYELVEVAGSHWLLDEQPDVVADAIIKRARSAG